MNLNVSNEKKIRPWFTWIISIVQIGIFVGELINNLILTNSLIEKDFSLNPLIGPSPYVLIQMGSSFPICMHWVEGIEKNESSREYPCPNGNKRGCTLSELCGFEGVSGQPNQWYRFILPICLHAGFVHLILNLFTQLMVVRDIEKKIGVIRVSCIYFVSGIFGFILGGNFASEGLSRMGCSGCLFGILAVALLDLFYHWKQTKYPKIQLIIHLVNILINFGIGLLPGIDNFSHVGGFFMGLLLGIIILGSPANFRLCQQPSEGNICQQFFSNRRKRWWIWCFVRCFSLIIAAGLFSFLIENFYSQRVKCSSCIYISCLPVNGWCDIGKLNLTTTSTTYLN